MIGKYKTIKDEKGLPIWRIEKVGNTFTLIDWERRTAITEIATEEQARQLITNKTIRNA